MSKIEIGYVTIHVMGELAYEDGEEVLDSRIPPTLELEVDLPGNNPIRLAQKFLARSAADILNVANAE